MTPKLPPLSITLVFHVADDAIAGVDLAMPALLADDPDALAELLDVAAVACVRRAAQLRNEPVDAALARVAACVPQLELTEESSRES